MQHLAIIPDGNRRWATQHKYEVVRGHQQGKEVFKSAITICLKNSIRYLSMYTFSLENFRRSALEKQYLFHLFMDNAASLAQDCLKHKIRVRFLGDLSRFPSGVQEQALQLQEKTAHHDTLHLNFLFGYGAQYEIVAAAKRIADQVKQGILSVEDINEDRFSRELLTAGMPDPDLIIRTGGVSRLSNFLLYQAAYSEFKFLDCFWPDVSEELLQQCIEEFKVTQRNFGY